MEITAYCPIFKETWTVDNYFVHSYGHTHIFDKHTMVLINAAFIRKYPQVMSSNIK